MIGTDGVALILSRGDALTLASEQGLDLVEVAPEANPPVAKLMNYSREQFRAQREAKKHKSADHSHEVKEIQLKATIELHDLQTKATAANKFLKKGNRVRVVVILRGRLQQRPEMVDNVLEKFFALLEGTYVAEHRSAGGGRTSVILRPSKPDSLKTA